MYSRLLLLPPLWLAMMLLMMTTAVIAASDGGGDQGQASEVTLNANGQVLTESDLPSNLREKMGKKKKKSVDRLIDR